MRHAKIQSPRNIVFLATVIMTSLTFPTLLSCTSGKDANKSRPLLNKSKSAANLKVDPTNTTQPTESATTRRNWTCASCGYANTKLHEVCTGCGLNKQDLLNKDKVKKPKVDKTANPDKHQPNDKPDASSPDKAVKKCPVCFEKNVLVNDLSHKCKQCKKLICSNCHQEMQERKMNFCPLCRYVPKHRRRSNTLP